MNLSAIRSGWRLKEPSIIPGFGLTLGFSLAYLSLIILIPIAGLIWRASSLTWVEFLNILLDERTLAALRISFGTALIAATSMPFSAF